MRHGPGNCHAIKHRVIGEVEAESVAPMIGAEGMDTSSHTVPYLSDWAGTVKDTEPVEVVVATGEWVRKAAAAILGALEFTLRRLTDSMEPDAQLLHGPRGMLTTATVRNATQWDDLVKELSLASLTRHACGTPRRPGWPTLVSRCTCSRRSSAITSSKPPRATCTPTTGASP